MHLDASELGKKSTYSASYNSDLLFSISRTPKRLEIGLDPDSVFFFGVDIWTHYEISWLNFMGKPIVAIGEIYCPATSPNIIESKSMKLYFNSFNNMKFQDVNDFIDLVKADISKKIHASIDFKIIALSDIKNNYYESSAICLDNLEISCDTYIPNINFLSVNNNLEVNETLYTNLLKSNCLVTSQPDWGSIYIEYKGKQINHEGLLKYIISYRNHNEFHEQCVEKIFVDIFNKCQPKELTVYARFTRRGGIEINPYRTTKQSFNFKNIRTVRQ